MTKVLIVDDEKVERDGLEKILQSYFSNMIIQQAQNGRTALQMVKTFQPELILMDIKMPGMSGIEVIRQIKSEHAGIKFIMMTAYAEFDYARSALKLGVVDYLVKPSSVQEIITTVERILVQITKENKKQELEKQQEHTLQKAMSLFETDVVTQLLFDHVHDVHIEELMEILDMHGTQEKFVISLILPKGLDVHYTVIKEIVRKRGGAWVGALYGHQLPIIVFRDPIQSFRAQATLLAREILSHINPANISSSFIGIGNVYTPLEQVRQSYQESLIATSDTAIPVKFRFYTDLPSIVPGIDTKANKQYEQQFFDYIRAGNWQEIHQCFTDFIDRSKQLGENLLQTSQKTRELLWIASRILGEMGVEHHTQFYYFKSTDYRQLSAEVLNYLKAMENSFQDHQSEFEADTIHYIKQFIIDHAHEEISLDRIGKEVGLSPIYISKCFKDQLGMNYIHFLTECRINKAQKLMRDPNKTLKEITFDVGYHDPNYFSKVFKKICKTSPTEYRNKLLHKV